VLSARSGTKFLEGPGALWALSRPLHKEAIVAKVTKVQLEDELFAKLDMLAASMGRPRGWLIRQAIKMYVGEQSGQVQAITEAMEAYRTGRIVFVQHEQVMKHIGAKINMQFDREEPND
jgi:predicted transcriptional regulator